MFDLSTMVAQSARRHPEKVALIEGAEQWTFAELDHAISEVAHGLAEQGFHPGEAVGLQLKNTAPFVITYYAVLRAGMIVVPFNPLAVEREVEHILSAAGCRGAVVPESTAGTVLDAATKIKDFLLIVDTDDDGAQETITAQVSSSGARDFLAFSELLRRADQRAPQPAVLSRADDDAVVIFTSGTTGMPKGAALSHFNLWMSCTALTTRSDPSSEEVALACLPLFHVFGMSGILNVSMAWGMTLVLAQKADPETVLGLIEEHGVTRFSAVPTMLSDFIQAGAQGRDLSSVRRVTSGGSTLRPGLISQFEEMFPEAALLEGYGASETTSSVCVNQSRSERRPGSVGTPSWGVQMRIADEDGSVLTPGAGHVGELHVRSPTVFNGYVGEPEETEATFDGEWFRTGDMARIDQDGYVYIVDRIKDVIIRAGYNVYPSEVEQVLQNHPGVAQAVVVGLPDDRVGQEIAALVVPSPGEQMTEELIKAYAREQLSAYKHPRIVKICQELPHSSTGKVLRRHVASAFS